MEVKASLKYLKTAPRKVRLLCDLIRGKDLSWAITQLSFFRKQAAKDLLPLLKSAESNAKQKNAQIKRLYIKEIRCDGGPVLKRTLIRSRGRATLVRKRMSHVSLVLSDDYKSQARKSFPVKPLPKQFSVQNQNKTFKSNKDKNLNKNLSK